MASGYSDTGSENPEKKIGFEGYTNFGNGVPESDEMTSKIREAPPTYVQVLEEDSIKKVPLSPNASTPIPEVGKYVALVPENGDDPGQQVDNVYPGLTKERKLRDVFCVGFLAVFIVLMTVIFIYAIVNGKTTCENIKQVLNDLSDQFNGIPKADCHEGWMSWILKYPTKAIKNGGEFIVYMTLIATTLAAMMMLMLRFFAKAMIWSVVIAIASIGAAMAIALWVWFFQSNNQMVLATALLVSVLGILVYSVLYYIRDRIKMVVRITKEAGKAIQAVPLVLLQPFLCVILELGLMAGAIYTFMLIQTVRVEKDSNNDLTPLAKLGRVFNLLGFFWMPLFVSACQQIVVAGVVGRWFFTRNKTELDRPMFNAYRTLGYTIGTAAFGSFILASVKIARFFVKMLKDRSIKKCQLLCTCLNACMKVLDKLIGHLSSNAYIITGLYGYGFCPAAKRSFKFLVDNAFNLLIINSVGDFVLFLAKLLVVIPTLFCGFLMINTKINEMAEEDRNYVIGCYLAIGLYFCMTIANAFIGMFETAIDTVFLCACVDKEKHGSNQPFYMSAKMQKIMLTNSVRDVGAIINNVRSEYANAQLR